MTKKRIASISISAAVLLSSCALKVTAIGTMQGKASDAIPTVFKLTKPDGAFQLVQTGDSSYLWLATNLQFPNPEGAEVYTRERVAALAARGGQGAKQPSIQYVDEGKYRVVVMQSVGNEWDYYHLFQEFGKIKDARTLKFSQYRGKGGIVYLFSYKK
jgi:hypothetical protein